MAYDWKISAKNIDSKKRTLKKHAVRFHGTIETVKSTAGFGEISMVNEIGEVFYINFNMKYFKHFSYKKGTPVTFSVALMPNRLRADGLDTKPFQDTQFNIYLPD